MLLLSVSLCFFAYPQSKSYSYYEPYKLWHSYFKWNQNTIGSVYSFNEPFSWLHRRPSFLLCKPIQGIDYSDNVRTPIQPFHFEKLLFETNYDYYLKITLQIFDSGQSVVKLEDDYFSEFTTINTVLNLKDYTDLMHILARCDFESFKEEKAIDEMKCCHSFFEIYFNNETKRSSGCAFSPFNNRELESVLWNIITYNIRHSKSSPIINY